MRIAKERWAQICFWLALALMLIAGRFLYQNYGFTVDESVERQTAFVNYQYAWEKLTGEKIRVIDFDLDTYFDRYYGSALQLPMVAVEHLTGFTMPLRDAFLLRHFYTFLICLGGWVCFYLFCKQVFHSRWLALLGMLMCAIYPRFWGEQFTNIKDMVFAAVCCASLLSISLCLSHEGKWRFEWLAALTGALCANTRFIGFQFPALLFGYRILRDWCLSKTAQADVKRWFVRVLPRYLMQLVLLLILYFLITPASWENPLDYLVGVFSTFSNYTKWNGYVIFLGKQYPGSQLPWYYLLTWILISTPLWYLTLMGMGFAAFCRTTVQNIRSRNAVKWLLDEYRYFVLCFVVAAIPLLTPLVKEVTLYDSWRHAYYVFPMLVVLALFGFRFLWRKASARKNMRRMLAGGAAVLLAGQMGWTAYNHPYEKVYFNPIGRQMAEMFDRDHWIESTYNQLRVILDHDETHRITIASDALIHFAVFNFLPEDEMNRFYVYYTGPTDADYYLDRADTVGPEIFEGYTPIHEERMRDGLVLTTLYIRNDVLQERFGGVFPTTQAENGAE